MVRLRTRDRGIPGSNPAWTIRFFLSRKFIQIAPLHQGVQMGTMRVVSQCAVTAWYAICYGLLKLDDQGMIVKLAEY